MIDKIQKISIVLAGGGTAGHIEPAMAVADALCKLHPKIHITTLGTVRGLETKLIPFYNYLLKLITPAPLPRKLSIDLFLLPFRIYKSICQTQCIFTQIKADIVIGFGGYVSFPAYFAVYNIYKISACKKNIPVIIYEANSKAGLVNKIGTLSAHSVLSIAKSTKLYRSKSVGMPLRTTISSFRRTILKSDSRKFWGFKSDTKVVLIFGGSQGAQSINQIIFSFANKLINSGVSILHSYGKNNRTELESYSINHVASYVMVPYIKNMELAYAASDLVVCRAGAVTVAEINSLGLPTIYIPLPIGNGEQQINPTTVVSIGGGINLNNDYLKGKFLIDLILELIFNKNKLISMSSAAFISGYESSYAAEKIAQIALSINDTKWKCI